MQQGGLPVIKQLLLVHQHWQSLSVRAELLCTAGTVGTDPVNTGILADLVSLFWGEFKLLFLAVEDFEISLCEGDSAVLSRTLLGWRTHALIRPLVHSHFQLSLEA